MKYVPGPWIGIAVPGTAVILEPGASAEQIEEIRERVKAHGIEGLVDALDHLSTASGTPSPSFAAVSVSEGTARLAARGTAAVRELAASEPRVRDGGQTDDALHFSWPGATGARLLAAGADIEATGVLWLESGVVFAGSIDVDLSGVAPVQSSPAVVATPTAPMETMIPDFTQQVSASATVDAPPSPAVPGDAHTAAADADADAEVDTDANATTDEDAAIDLTFGDIWGATLAIDDLGKATAAAPPRASAEGPPSPAVPPSPPAPPGPPAPPSPSVDVAPSATAPAPAKSGLIDGIPDVVRGPGSTDPGRPLSPTPAAPMAPPAPRLGDHDGSTVSVADMLAMQSGPPSTPIHTGTGSFSQRRRGRAHLSTGQVIEIDRTIIIGRLPRASRITGQPPQLVAVPSPQQDISRNHVEIRLEGSAVTVVDLNTTNGTVLHRVGTDAERLHPGEPTVVLDGDVIDLGDNVTVTFEGIG